MRESTDMTAYIFTCTNCFYKAFIISYTTLLHYLTYNCIKYLSTHIFCHISFLKAIYVCLYICINCIFTWNKIHICTSVTYINHRPEFDAATAGVSLGHRTIAPSGGAWPSDAALDTGNWRKCRPCLAAHRHLAHLQTHAVILA